MKWLGIAGLAVVAFLLFGAMQDKPAYSEDQQAYEYCLKEMRDELKSAAQRDILRQVCARQKNDYITKYGREP